MRALSLGRVVAVGVAGCALACATGYHPLGVAGGYSDLQVNENTFVVTFHGNGYTGAARASDMALLRSAQVATAHGFRYFVIGEAAHSTSVSAYTTPTESHTSGQIYGTTFQATTTTSGGQTHVISKPITRNTIVCFTSKPDIAGVIVYDADAVWASLSPQYVDNN